jgi:hypothetical protein
MTRDRTAVVLSHDPVEAAGHEPHVLASSTSRPIVHSCAPTTPSNVR